MKIVDKRVYRHRTTEQIKVRKKSVTVIRMGFKAEEPPVRNSTTSTASPTSVCQQREQGASDVD